jgi:hypothetical protein
LTPPIADPYSIPLPDSILENMISNPKSVKTYLKLRCLCEGHEMMMVNNLNSPSLRSDHPHLSGLTREEIFDCIEIFSLKPLIENAVQKTCAEVNGELHKREMERLANQYYSQTLDRMLRETLKERQEREREKRQRSTNGLRVIRR